MPLLTVIYDIVTPDHLFIESFLLYPDLIAQTSLHILFCGLPVCAHQSSFSAIAECVQVARAAVDSLHEIGLDLVCVLDSLSRKDIEKIIYIKRDHLLDAAQQRAREDLWRPMNHFNESMVLKYVGEMEALGLGAAVKPLVYDECWVSSRRVVTFWVA